MTRDEMVHFFEANLKANTEREFKLIQRMLKLRQEGEPLSQFWQWEAEGLIQLSLRIEWVLTCLKAFTVPNSKATPESIKAHLRDMLLHKASVPASGNAWLLWRLEVQVLAELVDRLEGGTL